MFYSKFITRDSKEAFAATVDGFKEKAFLEHKELTEPFVSVQMTYLQQAGEMAYLLDDLIDMLDKGNGPIDPDVIDFEKVPLLFVDEINSKEKNFNKKWNQIFKCIDFVLPDALFKEDLFAIFLPLKNEEELKDLIDLGNNNKNKHLLYDALDVCFCFGFSAFVDQKTGEMMAVALIGRDCCDVCLIENEHNYC